MKKILLLGLSSMLFWACSPRDIDSTIEDLDLTITTQKEGTVFTNYQTYAIPDSVYIITGDENNLDSFARNQTIDVTILNEIDTQMEQLGYVKVDTSENPDVGIFVARLINTTEGTAYVPGYCGGGWGWGYGGGGYWGYPGYGYCSPGAAYEYNYSTGTVMVSMVDLNTVDVENEVLSVLWTMVSNGYIEDNTKTANKSRIQTNIARGFEQSPYLQTN